MYNGHILFLTFHCIALGIGISGGGGERFRSVVCRKNFCNNNWYITGEKKKEKIEKKKKERKSKEVNSKCAILNGIIKSRFKTDIKNLLIRDSLQIGEGVED